MQGFVIFDHTDHYDAAYRDLALWLREGRLRYLEDCSTASSMPRVRSRGCTAAKTSASG